jgi:hypothetical protein
MTSFNTGTTGSASNVTQAAGFTFTVPAGVATNDVMITVVTCFTFTSASPAVAVPTSGGGTWTRLSPGLVDTGALGGLNIYATAWWRVATAADAGSTFTTSFTGPLGAGNQFWWSASLNSYSGFYTASPVASSAETSANNANSPANTPVLATVRGSSWAVYLVAAGVAGSGSITGAPAGSTDRERSNPGAGIDSDSADSNASVGPAGTSIGGGGFTFDHATGNQYVVWTVELASQAPAAPQMGGGGRSPFKTALLWADL